MEGLIAKANARSQVQNRLNDSARREAQQTAGGGSLKDIISRANSRASGSISSSEASPSNKSSASGGGMKSLIARANARTSSRDDDAPQGDVMEWAVKESAKKGIPGVERRKRDVSESEVQSYIDLTMTGDEAASRRKEEDKIKGVFKQAQDVMRAMKDAGVEGAAITKLEAALKEANKQTDKQIEFKNRTRLAKEFLANPGSKRGGKILKLERAVNGFGSLWRERWVEVKLGWLWCYQSEKRPDKGEKPQISIPLCNPTTAVERASEKFAEHFGQKFCLTIKSPDWSGKELSITFAFPRNDYLLQWEHIIKSARQDNHSMGPKPSLLKCTQKGDLNAVKALLAETKLAKEAGLDPGENDVNVTNRYDFTPLHYAVIGVATSMHAFIDAATGAAEKPTQPVIKPAAAFEVLSRLMAAGADCTLENRGGETPLDLADSKCRDLPATRRLLRKVLKSSRHEYDRKKGGAIYIIPEDLQRLLQIVRKELPKILNNKDASYQPNGSGTSGTSDMERGRGRKKRGLERNVDDSVSSRGASDEDARAAAARRLITANQYAHRKGPSAASSRSVSPASHGGESVDPLKKFYSDLERLKRSGGSGRSSPADSQSSRGRSDSAWSDRSGRSEESASSGGSSWRQRSAPVTDGDRLAYEIEKAKRAARRDYRSVSRASSRSSRSSRSRSRSGSSRGTTPTRRDLNDPSLAFTSKDLSYAHGAWKGSSGARSGRASSRSSRGSLSSGRRSSRSPRTTGRSGGFSDVEDSMRDKTRTGEAIRRRGRRGRRRRRGPSPYRGGTPRSDGSRTHRSTPRSGRERKVTPRSGRRKKDITPRNKYRRGRRSRRRRGDRSGDGRQNSGRSSGRRSGRRSSRRVTPRERHAAKTGGALGSGSTLTDLKQQISEQLAGEKSLKDQMFPEKRDLAKEKRSMQDLIAKANARKSVSSDGIPNASAGGSGGSGGGGMANLIAKANARKSKSSHGKPTTEDASGKSSLPNWKANQVISHYLKQGGAPLHRTNEEVTYDTKDISNDFFQAINSKKAHKSFEELEDAFKILAGGTDSETVPVNQLQSILGQWGERLKKREMRQFLAVADPKGLGYVRYKDLVNFLVKERLDPLESDNKLYNTTDDVAGQMKAKRIHHEQVVLVELRRKQQEKEERQRLLDHRAKRRKRKKPRERKEPRVNIPKDNPLAGGGRRKGGRRGGEGGEGSDKDLPEWLEPKYNALQNTDSGAYSHSVARRGPSPSPRPGSREPSPRDSALLSQLQSAYGRNGRSSGGGRRSRKLSGRSSPYGQSPRVGASPRSASGSRTGTPRHGTPRSASGSRHGTPRSAGGGTPRSAGRGRTRSRSGTPQGRLSSRPRGGGRAASRSMSPADSALNELQRTMSGTGGSVRSTGSAGMRMSPAGGSSTRTYQASPGGGSSQCHGQRSRAQEQTFRYHGW